MISGQEPTVQGRVASEGQRHLQSFLAPFTKEVAFLISGSRELYVFSEEAIYLKTFSALCLALCDL